MISTVPRRLCRLAVRFVSGLSNGSPAMLRDAVETRPHWRKEAADASFLFHQICISYCALWLNGEKKVKTSQTTLSLLAQNRLRFWCRQTPEKALVFFSFRVSLEDEICNDWNVINEKISRPKSETEKPHPQLSFADTARPKKKMNQSLLPLANLSFCCVRYIPPPL